MHLHILSSKVRDFFREVSNIVDGARGHLVRLDDSCCESDAVIVLTERRCLVNDTRPALAGDVCVIQDSECPVFVLRCGLASVRRAANSKSMH